MFADSAPGDKHDHDCLPHTNRIMAQGYGAVAQRLLGEGKVLNLIPNAKAKQNKTKEPKPNIETWLSFLKLWTKLSVHHSVTKQRLDAINKVIRELTEDPERKLS